MAVDNVLDVSHQSFWRRVSGSPDDDVADLPLQLLSTTEALALRLAAVDTVGDSGGTEKDFVIKQLGELWAAESGTGVCGVCVCVCVCVRACMRACLHACV